MYFGIYFFKHVGCVMNFLLLHFNVLCYVTGLALLNTKWNFYNPNPPKCNKLQSTESNIRAASVFLHELVPTSQVIFGHDKGNNFRFLAIFTYLIFGSPLSLDFRRHSKKYSFVNSNQMNKIKLLRLLQGVRNQLRSLRSSWTS